jgi:hypothetical protein
MRLEMAPAIRIQNKEIASQKTSQNTFTLHPLDTQIQKCPITRIGISSASWIPIEETDTRDIFIILNSIRIIKIINDIDIIAISCKVISDIIAISCEDISKNEEKIWPEIFGIETNIIAANRVRIMAIEFRSFIFISPIYINKYL